VNQKTNATNDKSLTPGPTKESRSHAADLPGAAETKQSVDSQKKAVPTQSPKTK
jgi:hypothetical protein